jgi:UPF0755 protein
LNEYESQMRVPDAKVPKKRRSALTRVLGTLFGLSFLGALALGAFGIWGYANLTTPGPLVADKILEIPKGKSPAEIGLYLQEQGVISDARLFAITTYARNAIGGRLRAGEYEFPANASTEDVIAILNAGKVVLYKLTIPEGWTSEMALARIASNEVLTGPAPTPPIEAALMPDTYVFQRGMTREKLVADMAEAQIKMLDELWANRAAHAVVKTKEEAVILASIVEKETGVAEERPQVASVFSNRIAKGMRLQSDPTIIYGLVGGKGKLDRQLTKADIASQTPYNTYVIDGLPPGPIASPGRAAIEAVLNPDKTEYIYFVADGTGGHAFAKTLEEHNANVKKWRELTSAPEEAAVAPATVVPETPEVPAVLPTPAEEKPAEPVVPAVVAEKPAAPVVPAVVAEQPAEPAAVKPAEKPLKPGSTITLAGKLVPIPKAKPKR